MEKTTRKIDYNVQALKIDPLIQAYTYGYLDQINALNKIKLIWPKLQLTRSSNEASTSYNQGIDLHQQGNLDKSITKYRETIDADPKNAGAYLNLGTIYYNQGKFHHG